MSFKLDAYCYYNFCCSRFSSEIQESSEKGLLTIKDLLEVKNLLIFWVQKVRTECDVLLYLCVYFTREKTTKQIFEKKLDSSTQFVTDAMETLFLLEKVRIAKKEFQFSNSIELLKLKSTLNFSYTNLLILKQIQFPELQSAITFETDKAKKARYSRIINGGPSPLDLKCSNGFFTYWDHIEVWPNSQRKNKSQLSIPIDQIKLSLDFFDYLHDRKLFFDIYTLSPNMIEHLEDFKKYR